MLGPHGQRSGNHPLHFGLMITGPLHRHITNLTHLGTSAGIVATAASTPGWVPASNAHVMPHASRSSLPSYKPSQDLKSKKDRRGQRQDSQSLQLYSSVIAHLPARKGESQEGCALQAMVELYEFLLKCSCDLAQEAPPPRKFRMSGGNTKSPDSCNSDIKQSHRICPCAMLCIHVCSNSTTLRIDSLLHPGTCTQVQLRSEQHTGRYRTASESDSAMMNVLQLHCSVICPLPGGNRHSMYASLCLAQGDYFQCMVQSSAVQTQPMRTRPCSQISSVPSMVPVECTAASSLAPSRAV